MYKLIRIEEYTMTRDIELENLDTGTRDICFDDSILNDDINFEFMEIGKEYDCKILLFGILTTNKGEDVVECVINKEVKIGNYNFLEVKVNNDIYYLSKAEAVQEGINDKVFLYDVGRKNILQVNDIIHHDLLE